MRNKLFIQYMPGSPAHADSPASSYCHVKKIYMYLNEFFHRCYASANLILYILVHVFEISHVLH